MSVHIKEMKNESNGRMEWVIRYPGWTQQDAQLVADAINGGAISDYHTDKAARDSRLIAMINEPQNYNPDLCA